jgi:ATP adenylyltransferase
VSGASGLEHLWAGWRSEYIEAATEAERDARGDGGEGCVFCRILSSPLDDEARHVVWAGSRCVALLNAYPYTSGHLMVLPRRHVGEIEELTADEAAEVWSVVTDAVRAIKAAYAPGGVNIGANLGRAAGAGVPGHFHVHCLPRWNGDTNFMTSVAETRVMPEALPVSWRKLTEAWPGARPRG